MPARKSPARKSPVRRKSPARKSPVRRKSPARKSPVRRRKSPVRIFFKHTGKAHTFIGEKPSKDMLGKYDVVTCVTTVTSDGRRSTKCTGYGRRK